MTEQAGDVCKGVVGRFRLSAYASAAAITQKLEFRVLKSLSCPGCAACGGIWDYVTEELDNNGPDAIDLSGLQPEKLYRLHIVTTPGSYEYPEEVEATVEFVEHKESQET